MPYCSDTEEIFKSVIAKVGLCEKYNLLNQYFSNLNLISELPYLELPEKSISKVVKFDTWNNSTTATVP